MNLWIVFAALAIIALDFWRFGAGHAVFLIICFVAGILSRREKGGLS